MRVLLKFIRWISLTSTAVDLGAPASTSAETAQQTHPLGAAVVKAPDAPRLK